MRLRVVSVLVSGLGCRAMVEVGGVRAVVLVGSESFGNGIALVRLLYCPVVCYWPVIVLVNGLGKWLWLSIVI